MAKIYRNAERYDAPLAKSRSMPPGEDDRMAEPFDATRRGEDGSRSETDEV